MDALNLKRYIIPLCTVSILYLCAGYVILDLFSSLEATTTPRAIAFLVGAIACFVAACFARYTAMRFFAFLCFFICMYLGDYDPLHTSYVVHLWIYTLAILAFTTTEYLENGLFVARVVALSTYLFAGFWKLKFLLVTCVVQHACLLSGASILFADHSFEPAGSGMLTAFFVQHHVLAFSGYVVVAISQAAVLPMYFQRKLRIFVPYVLIAFHLLVYLVMNMFYYDDILLIIILFILPERLLAMFGYVEERWGRGIPPLLTAPDISMVP